MPQASLTPGKKISNIFVLCLAVKVTLLRIVGKIAGARLSWKPRDDEARLSPQRYQ